MSQQPKKDGAARVLCCLLARHGDYDAVEATVALHVGRSERGAIRLCSFLARTAPLAGLAGTLVGIQEALGEFALTGDPQSVIGGFATAIQTTEIGVFVAITALITSRLLWEPPLKRRTSQLLEFALTAKPLIGDILARISRENAVRRARRIEPVLICPPRAHRPPEKESRDDVA